MRRSMRTVLMITTIAIAIAASIAATSWAELSTKTKEAVVDSSKAPKLKPQAQSSPAVTPKLKPQTKPRSAGSIADQHKPPRPNPQPSPPPIGMSGGVVMQPMIVKPDLQVEQIILSNLNSDPKEGQEVTVIASIKNYGLGAAQNPEVALTTTVAGPTGVSIPVFPFTYNTTLTQDQGRNFIKKFIVPKWGTYTCTLRVDSANKIAETNENNNQKSVSFSVDPAPDLTVCIDNGKRPPRGRKREIKAVVKNIGHGSTGTADLKLSFYVEGHGVQYYDIPMLSGGGAHTITRNHKWPTAGTKTITARVIYDGYELNPQNNEVNGSYFVRLPHHDVYGVYNIKCSTGATFNNWQNCWDQYINASN